MDQAVRSYIVRILLLHVAFLIAVAAVIVSAGTALYASAKADAETAALERASVPVNQTKDLLERHFQAIFDTLRLADRPAGASTQGTRPRSVIASPGGVEVWGQLRAHLSGLVEVDARALGLVGYHSDPSTTPAIDTVDGDDPLRVFPQPPQGPGFRISTREAAERLVEDAADFLRQVAESRQPSVSSVVWLEGGGPAGQSRGTPVVLAAMPMPAGVSGTGASSAPRVLLLGVIPVAYLEDNFLIPAGQAERSGMLLFDSSGRLVAGGGDALAGKTVGELAPRHIPVSLANYILNTVSGGAADVRLHFAGQVDIAGSQFSSALATSRTVRLGERPPEAPGVTESGLGPELASEAQPTGSPGPSVAPRPPRSSMWLFALVNREAVLSPLAQTARTAILWAAAMVLAVSAILLSTAIQLIRGRSRLERLRTEMIDRELREARQIQLMWLPDDAVRHTPTRLIEISAQNIPASHISGDFYNYFDLPDGRTALVIGDVTGHGLVAAFLMATTQLLVRTSLQRLGDPGAALEDVNNQLCSQSYHGQFVTIQLIVIDPRGRHVRAASAGHPPPLVCGADGTWSALPLEPQLVLGVMAGSEYPTQTIPLGDSRSLLLYTDGVIEVKNAQDDRFSLEMLLERLNERMGASCGSARNLIDTTVQIVQDFSGDTAQDDDLTLLAVHLEPTAAREGRNEQSTEPASADAGRSSQGVHGSSAPIQARSPGP